MNVLITGSTGFVGQNLLPFLVENNIKLFSLDRQKNLTSAIEKAFVWEELEDISFGTIDAIIHMAGKAHDVKGTSDESQYMTINLGLTKTLLACAVSKGFTGKFLHFSSVKAVADRVEGPLLVEEVEGDPQTPYGKSKLAAEKLLQAHYKGQEERLFILRPCMIHGPHNKGNLNLLYKFVVKGVPYPLAAFENKRSLLSVGNLCFVLNELLQREVKGGVYNLADDGAFSTTEIVEVMGKVVAKKVRLLAVPKVLVQGLARLGDVIPLPLNTDRLQKLTENYVVDNTKIKDALGVSLPVSLEEGLARTIKSFS
jgi:nucleoside-diphosphate-sugar epimerase